MDIKIDQHIFESTVDAWTYRREAQHGKKEGAVLTPEIRKRGRIRSCFEWQHVIQRQDKTIFQGGIDRILRKKN